MIITRPLPEDAPTWYAGFLKKAPGDDLIAALQSNKVQMVKLMRSIPAEMENYKYADDKWTIKQVFIHLADDERYYAYKAFCYSRQVDCFLEVPQGDAYNKDFNAANRTLKDICDELITIRDATISLFSNMTTEMLDFKNLPKQPEVYTARALGWFAVGHNIHHCNVIKEKYLKQ